jgi:hypothetical protein
MTLCDGLWFIPALQLGFQSSILLQAIEVLEKEEPGGLLGIIEFGGATGLFPEDIINVLEGLFEHVKLVVLC